MEDFLFGPSADKPSLATATPADHEENYERCNPHQARLYKRFSQFHKTLFGTHIICFARFVSQRSGLLPLLPAAVPPPTRPHRRPRFARRCETTPSLVTTMYLDGEIGRKRPPLPTPYSSNRARRCHIRLAQRRAAFTIEEGMLGVLDGRTDGAQDALLVLDGVKMGATVTLNGVVLGTCTNQFLRYTHS